jgi:hypothetical protein
MLIIGSNIPILNGLRNKTPSVKMRLYKIEQKKSGFI